VSESQIRKREKEMITVGQLRFVFIVGIVVGYLGNWYLPPLELKNAVEFYDTTFKPYLPQWLT
jgi:hypothetical protein